MDNIAPRKECARTSVKKESPSPEKGKFARLLVKEEEEEKREPLLDGPYTAPLMPTSPSGASSAPQIRAIPSWAMEMVSSLVEPLRSAAEKGVTTIEVTVTSKELSTIRIMIDHYDTAPQSFNIQLQGTEGAQRLFNKHQALLERLLKITLPHFECRFLPATLKEEKWKKRLVKSEAFGYLPEEREKEDAAH
jgi:hypothetical protein